MEDAPFEKMGSDVGRQEPEPLTAMPQHGAAATGIHKYHGAAIRRVAVDRAGHVDAPRYEGVPHELPVLVAPEGTNVTAAQAERGTRNGQSSSLSTAQKMALGDSGLPGGSHRRRVGRQLQHLVDRVRPNSHDIKHAVRILSLV